MKVIIKPEICEEQVKVLREIKALKKKIKFFAKRLANLSNQIDYLMGNCDESYYDLLDDWYECDYHLKKTKKDLKNLRDRYYFFL